MKGFNSKTRRPETDGAGTGIRKTRKPERKRIKAAKKKPWQPKRKRTKGKYELAWSWANPKDVLSWEFERSAI